MRRLQGSVARRGQGTKRVRIDRGLRALIPLTRFCYEACDPEEWLVAPVFANVLPDLSQRATQWLGEIFGGAKWYSGEYGGYERMLSQHTGREITEDKRAKWIELLGRAATDAGLPNDADL
jgi:truncated hemoglobin YjbI